MKAGSRRPPLLSVLLGILAALVVVLIAPVQAQAAFNAGVSQTVVLGTPTLQPPAGVTLTKSCGSILADPATMTATWTATASTFAAGYTVVPYLNGAAQTPVVVAGRGTTTATVSITRNTLLATNTWTFKVYARAGSAWTSSSVDPAPGSITCPVLSL